MLTSARLLRSRLAAAALHVVSNRIACEGRSLEEAIVLAVEGGAGVVHLREPDLGAGELLALARRLRSQTAERALLIVNDRIDVALLGEADGVQLGWRSLPVSAARQLVGNRLLIGRSVQSVEEAVAAQREGADYLLVGTIFPSRSHPGGQATGPAIVRAVRQAVDRPIVGIGGIDATNAAEVIRAGASGVAVIRAVLGAPDPRAAARELVEAVRKASFVTTGGSCRDHRNR